MAPPIPLVEVPYHADSLRIGRPDGKGDAVHAVKLQHVSAQFLVRAVIVAFAKEVQVEIAQHRRKGVDVR